MANAVRMVAVTALSLVVVACTPPLAPAPTAAPPPPAAAPTTAPAKAAPAAAQATAAPAKPAATASASQQALADATAKYYEAAKKEGKLVIYQADTPVQFDPVKAAFQARFPGIEVQNVQQTASISREKIITEQGSRNYVADILQTGGGSVDWIVQSGNSEPYQTPQIADIVPELQPVQKGVVPSTGILRAIAINTNLVKPDQEPKTWADVLDPKWKGKIAMDEPRGDGPGLLTLSSIELVYGREWSEKLKAQQPFFALQGPILTGLVRGEYSLYLSASHNEMIAQRKAGAPIKLVKPSDGIALSRNAAAMVKNQPHPNAARLYIEWYLSEEGQKVLAQQGYVAVRKGIVSEVPESNLQGVKFLGDPYTDAANAKLGNTQERTERWDKLFFKS